MTPARKKALQWFHDRGEVHNLYQMDRTEIPSTILIMLMIGADQLTYNITETGTVHNLTDKGRRALHGDKK